MVELNCNAQKCSHNSHNEDNLCCIPNVNIGGCSSCSDSKNTCCESFSTEHANGIEKEHPDHYISVHCDATSCMYNDHNQCISTHVDIAGMKALTEQQTQCNSFACR